MTEPPPKVERDLSTIISNLRASTHDLMPSIKEGTCAYSKDPFDFADDFLVFLDQLGSVEHHVLQLMTTDQAKSTHLQIKGRSKHLLSIGTHHAKQFSAKGIYMASLIPSLKSNGERYYEVCAKSRAETIALLGAIL